MRMHFKVYFCSYQFATKLVTLKETSADGRYARLLDLKCSIQVVLFWVSDVTATTIKLNICTIKLKFDIECPT